MDIEKIEHFAVIQSSLLCEECEFAATELKTVVEDERSQKKVKTFLSHEVCSRLRRYQGSVSIISNFSILKSLFFFLNIKFINNRFFFD